MRRVLTALAILPFLFVAIWAGGEILFVLLAVVGIIMAYEWVRLLASARPQRDTTFLCSLLCALLLVGFFTSANYALCLLLVLVMVFAGGAMFVGFRMAPVVGGAVYLGWPLLAMAFFRDNFLGGFVLLYILVSVFAVDIFAMFLGKFFGGPRLAQRISPNKTWAGMGGAVLGSVLVGIITYFSANWVTGMEVELPAILLLAAIIAVIAQLGDLFESALKRKYGLKDTGSILPGHGGALDRLDGVIAVLIFLHIIVVMRGHSPADAIWVW
tara:strand:- start:1567 stop:2376 length:810 start_codon:yes stop_codon:yes gene_type:complete